GRPVGADPGEREVRRFDQRVDPDNPPNSFNWLHGGGIMVADYDGDGHQDILAPAEPYTRYYKGRGDGLFDMITEPVFGELETSMGNGGAAADYDGDGDIDVYLLRYQAPNVLLQNNGDGRFTQLNVDDASEQVVCPGCPDGIGGAPRWDSLLDEINEGPPSTTASWVDFDHDGDLDLFVGNYGVPDQSGEIPTEDFGPAFPSYVYRNRGDGTFEDASSILPQIVHDGYTYAGGWHDVDDDGWHDLLVVNDFGPAYPNTAMRNDGGTLVEGWRSNGLWAVTTGMGLGIADINGDGWLDLLIPEYEKMSLWRSNLSFGDEPLWIDAARAAGIQGDPGRDQMVGWGAEFADIDNDADLDAIVAFGYIGTVHPSWHNPRQQPDAIYLNDGSDMFTDVAEEWGMADLASSRGFALVDMNHDGWLDLLKRDLEGPNVIWMSNCGEDNWLIVRPRESTGMNRFAVGARVWVEAGGRTFVGDVRAGGTSFASSGPAEVHTGLGDLSVIDRITVRWPDNEQSRIEGPIDASQVITITR
ncbi:MAG: hypothetical protein ACI9K2_001821, partial [Myxococcota bacterium]